MSFLMNPRYHFIDPPSSPFVVEDLNLALQPISSASSSSSSSRTSLVSDQDLDGPSPQDQSRFTQPQPADRIQTHQELHNDCQLVSSDSLARDITRLDSFQSKEDMSEDGEDHEDYYSSHKWLPSKLRIIRKMMSSNKSGGNRVAKNSAHEFEDQKQSPSPRPIEPNAISKGVSYRSNDNTIRVCSDCNTTKTPLWRSGPRGPKSLCNACGIRQRKARRALAAAAAAADGTILPPAARSIKIKVKSKTKKPRNDGNASRQLKKGWNQQNTSPPNSKSPTKKINNLWYEDFTSRILNKHYSTYQRVFPQDEREAAILLMALSYGLVHG